MTPPARPVVGSLDGHRHRPAGGHRRRVEAPGGAGSRSAGSLHRHDVCAADHVVGQLDVPEGAGEGVGACRPGCGDGVGEGGVPLQGEPYPVAAQLRHLAGGEGAGDVGEPGGQRLRDPASQPVVGSLDGHRHRPAGGHRRRVEAPGGAGSRSAGSLHRHGVCAADHVVGQLDVPEGAREDVGACRPGCGDGVGEGGVPLQGEPYPVAAQLRHLAGGEGAGDVGEPGGQRLRDPASQPVAGSLDGHSHRPAGGHRRRVEAPGGADLCLCGCREDAYQGHRTRCRNDHDCYQRSSEQGCSIQQDSSPSSRLLSLFSVRSRRRGLRSCGTPSLFVGCPL